MISFQRTIRLILMLALPGIAAPAFSQSATAPSPTAKAVKPAKQAAKPRAAKPGSLPAAETGPYSLGVISAIGDRFYVDKFGLTVFETEETVVSIAGWGLDDLVFDHVRAFAGADRTVRRISYPKDAFEPYYHPKSRFLPDPHESLSGVVRDITGNAGCERYLVIATYTGKIPNTNLELTGVGTWNRGLGSLMRNSHLFANIVINMIDGSTYERIDSPFTITAGRLAESLRITEDPITQIDNQYFPDPPSTASGSAMLRDRMRALVATTVDRRLPDYLKTQ